MEKQEQNGYCPTCKKPMPRIELCKGCVGRRSGAQNMSDIKVKPPQINTLYKEEKQKERLNNNK